MYSTPDCCFFTSHPVMHLCCCCVSAGARATLGRGGIMNLLFGHHRALRGAHEVFRDMPRLPLSLRPMQGDLAATINRGTRGLDIGQADLIWVSCAIRGGGGGTKGGGVYASQCGCQPCWTYQGHPLYIKLGIQAAHEGHLPICCTCCTCTLLHPLLQAHNKRALAVLDTRCTLLVSVSTDQVPWFVCAAAYAGLLRQQLRCNSSAGHQHSRSVRTAAAAVRVPAGPPPA